MWDSLWRANTAEIFDAAYKALEKITPAEKPIYYSAMCAWIDTNTQET
jgi:hypothetical protein